MPFSSLGLPDPITRGVRAAGYATPTPIQAKAVPLILPGHDVVVAAQTGSGKTAAFLLPVLTRLLRGPRALRALVLVPTRELAAQVETCAHKYARYADIRIGVVFGGVPISPQERLLRRDGVDLLVATPGRLLDLHGRQSVSLEDIEVLVLDEADRMVDMGFAPDLRRILALLPRERQTLMFSATMPPELNAVAREALTNPRRVDLTPVFRAPRAIKQTFYPVPRHLKVDLLDRIFARAGRPSAIVFSRTKRGADRLAQQLKRRGHALAVLHGDRTQGQRERALEDFRNEKVAVLVATDIAARGIDVDHVRHVVNFDVPRTPDEYVHRIGRTGRMEAAGDAVTLVSPEEHAEVKAIERALGHPLSKVTVPDFDYSRARSHESTRSMSEEGTTVPRHRSALGGPRRSGRKTLPGMNGASSRSAAQQAREPGYGRRRKLNVAKRKNRKRI